MAYEYKTHGTCSRKITVELDGQKIKRVSFDGGCAGNTAGIAKIVVGMNAQDVIKQFAGITCGPRPTSCPDQLSIAVQEALDAQAHE